MMDLSCWIVVVLEMIVGTDQMLSHSYSYSLSYVAEADLVKLLRWDEVEDRY